MLLDEAFLQTLAFASPGNQTTIHNFHTHFHDTYIVVLAAVQKPYHLSDSATYHPFHEMHFIDSLALPCEYHWNSSANSQTGTL